MMRFLQLMVTIFYAKAQSMVVAKRERIDE